MAWMPSSDIDKSFVSPSAALVHNSYGTQLIRDKWGSAWSKIPEVERNRGLMLLDGAKSNLTETHSQCIWLKDASIDDALNGLFMIAKIANSIFDSNSTEPPPSPSM